MRGGVLLYLRQCDAGLNGHGLVLNIQRDDAIEPCEVENQARRVFEYCAAADQSGIAALGNQGNFWGVGGAQAHDLTDLLNVFGQGHRQRCAVIAVALVGVKGLGRFAGAHMALTHEAAQLGEKGGEIRLAHDRCWMIQFVRILLVRILLARALGE